MTSVDNLDIHVDTSEQREDIPGFNEAVSCPEHPWIRPEVGYGLAGGGFGVYTTCPVCYRILSKSQDPEE
jgi:hypothetical protein